MKTELFSCTRTVMDFYSAAIIPRFVMQSARLRAKVYLNPAGQVFLCGSANARELPTCATTQPMLLSASRNVTPLNATHNIRHRITKENETYEKTIASGQ
jgi:hypothetical protein